MKLHGMFWANIVNYYIIYYNTGKYILLQIYISKMVWISLDIIFICLNGDYYTT